MYEINVSNALFTEVHTMVYGGDYEAVAGLIEGANEINGTVFLDDDEDGFQDPGENGQSNITVKLYIDENNDGIVDAGDTFADTEITDSNGDYNFEIAVQGNFVLEIDTGTLPPSSSMTTDNVEEADFVGFGNVDNGNDFGFYFSAATIGNYVWKDFDQDGVQDGGEEAFENITVNLYASGGIPAGSTTTNSSGVYSFSGLVPGDYYVEFIAPNGYQFSPQDAGGDDNLDSDANTATGQTIVTTLTSGENDASWDAGIHATVTTASIGNYVWKDLDQDGIQDDGGESSFEGVTVNLYERDYSAGSYDQRIQTSTDDAHQEGTTMKVGDNDLKVGKTDRNGGMRFTGLNIPSGSIISSAYMYWDQGDGGSPQTSLDIFAHDVASPGTFTTTSNDITDRTSLTTNFAKFDIDWSGDENGIQTPSLTSIVQELVDNYSGINEIAFLLLENTSTTGEEAKVMSYDDKPLESARLVVEYDYPDGDSFVGTTTTDANGLYSFTYLIPKEYLVEFELPVGYLFSPQDQGGDDALDSDANTTTGKTIYTTLTSGENDITWDAGVYQNLPASVGNYVWKDLDEDGIQDGGEEGFSAVTVNLYTSNGTPAGSTTTNSSGLYSFIGLTPGNYYLEFVAPSGYQFSPQDAGGDDALDSDINITTGQTDVFTLLSGGTDNTIDAGLYTTVTTASIGNYVWKDLDQDGIQDDGGESSFEGVTVNLYERDYSAGSYDQRIQTSTDDAHQEDQNVKLTDNALKLGKDASRPGGGMRFTGLNIPAGSTINSAIMYWDNDDGGSKTSSVNIYAHDIASPGTFTSTDYDISSRPKTSNFVKFDINWSGDENGAPTPELKTLVQELVDDYNGISNIAFIVTNNASSDDEIKVISYDSALSEAPRLVVDYTYPDGDSFVGTTTTDANGLYSFTYLIPKEYLVEFELPVGYLFSPQDQGGDDALDSDANITTGKTIYTTLTSGEDDITWDAGVYQGSLQSVGDYVWNDDNHNGLQDDATPGDPANGLKDVKVILYDGDGVEIEFTLTDANGWYEFDNLIAGDYKVGVDETTVIDLDYPTYDYDGIETPYEASFTLGVTSGIFDLDFGFSDMPLPVVLTDFTAEILADRVKLTWITESEVENQGFFIHRKLESEEAWQELSTFLNNPGLRGQGSVTYQTEYEYIDSTALSGFTYEYRLGDVDYNTAMFFHDDLTIRIEVNCTAIPDKFSLQPAYPNPFNPITTILYSIPEATPVKLFIYDITGKLVRKLVNNVENPGIKEVIWNGRNEYGKNVHSGMYIYSLHAGDYHESKKILLIR